MQRQAFEVSMFQRHLMEKVNALLPKPKVKSFA